MAHGCGLASLMQRGELARATREGIESAPRNAAGGTRGKLAGCQRPAAGGEIIIHTRHCAGIFQPFQDHTSDRRFAALAYTAYAWALFHHVNCENQQSALALKNPKRSLPTSGGGQDYIPTDLQRDPCRAGTVVEKDCHRSRVRRG